MKDQLSSLIQRISVKKCFYRYFIFSISIILLTGITQVSNAKPDVLFVLEDQNSFVASRAFNIFHDIYGQESLWGTSETLDEGMIKEATILVILTETVEEDGAVSVAKKIYVGEKKVESETGTLKDTSLTWVDIYHIQAFELALDIFKDIHENYEDHYIDEIYGTLKEFYDNNE